MLGPTSCWKSLSPVTITTSPPAAAMRVASVPITSSASTPRISTTRGRSASTTRRMSPICGTSSSGIDERFALYSAYISSRNEPPGASNTSPRCVGCSSFKSLSSMLVTPYAALVGTPRDVDRNGIAWNAR